MYKSIDELTDEQFEELCDRTNAERSDLGKGELTPEQVKEKYRGTCFTDDDFFCSAGR